MTTISCFFTLKKLFLRTSLLFSLNSIILMLVLIVQLLILLNFLTIYIFHDASISFVSCCIRLVIWRITGGELHSVTIESYRSSHCLPFTPSFETDEAGMALPIAHFSLLLIYQWYDLKKLWVSYCYSTLRTEYSLFLSLSMPLRSDW